VRPLGPVKVEAVAMFTSAITAIATLLSLFSFAYSAPSQACSQPNRSPIDWRPKANDTKVFFIGSDPQNPREIRLSVPPLYNGSNINLPLVLAFHDKDQAPAQLQYNTRFSDHIVNEKKIMVFPKAVNVSTSPLLAKDSLTVVGRLGYMAVEH
jgi:poly(3-hydroxybutyrate) depolymerase